MEHEKHRVKIKVGTTAEAADGALLVSVPSVRIAEYGDPETRVDVIVGAVGRENLETTLRVGQRIEYDSGPDGLYEIRLLSSESPIELLVSGLGAAKPDRTPEEPPQ